MPALYLGHGFELHRSRSPAGARRRWKAATTAARYHQPSDEISPDWNFDGMIEDVQLGFWTAYIVGNAPTMPTWVGDEFEAARKKAICDAAR